MSAGQSVSAAEPSLSSSSASSASYLLIPNNDQRLYASSVTSSSLASTTTAMLMQQLQQSIATSAPTSQSLFMDELLLKHAAAALAAQKLEPVSSSTPNVMTSPSSLQMQQQPLRPESQAMSDSTRPDSTLRNDTPRDEQKSTNICCVCNDEASGRHYGSVTCFGCKGFFRRTVRSGKVYACRYEERCQIDKVGRNICRACRFRKCIDAGMEPDAIRPDRDKTGRQKNPRRSGNSMCSSKSYSGALDVDMSDGRMSRTSPNLDGQSSVSSPPSDEDFQLRSYCESATPSSAALQQKNLIVGTLAQIEAICSDLLDDPKQSPDAERDQEDEERSASLTDVITRTSIVARRTPLDYSGRLPLRDPNTYSSALRRLAVMTIDYANTLKPIADMEPNEKIILIRSFIAPFILLTTSYKSVQEGRMGQILLPNGYFVDSTTSLGAFRDESGAETRTAATSWLEGRIGSTRSSIIDRLNATIEKLGVSEAEFICLKAILALDPNVSQLSEASAQKLMLARDSVQNALYVHLTEQYGDHEAITRFGRLLMLLTNVTKTGAHFAGIMQMGRELQPNIDSLILDLFAI